MSAKTFDDHNAVQPRTIVLQITEGVAELRLNRPQQKNAISQEMSHELSEAITSIDQNSDVKVVILSGAGGAFCSGGDTRSLAASASSSPGEMRRRMHRATWIEQLLNLDKPIIAAVDGVAFGAGFSMALAADFILASRRARFCFAFMRLGLVPDCGATYSLPRLVGLQRAKELFFSARELDAYEAQDLGIVLEVHEENALLHRAREIATSLTHASPIALSLAKRALNASLGSDLKAVLEAEANAQAIAYSTEYRTQAVARLIQKEAPLFQWPGKKQV